MVIALGTIVLVLIFVGVLLFLINKYAPIQGSILEILNFVVVGAVVVWLVRAFGIWDWLNHVQL